MTRRVRILNHRLILAAALVAGCKDTTAPTPGRLQVSATTSGADLDPDGYLVSVDGGAALAIGTNGTISMPGLPPGDHAVRLNGVAPNCSVDGVNPRTVTVVAGATMEISFLLLCTALTGSVRVTIATSGVDPDPNGYFVSLDDDELRAIGTNEAVTLDGLIPGDHAVELTEVAANCDVRGSTVQTFTVPKGGTVVVAFDIVCAPVTRLAFASDVDGNEEIYAINSNGSGMSRLTSNTAWDWSPSWSPDGSKIAFESERDGNMEIYVMNADGSSQVRVTNDTAADRFPSWSPDGTKIAFTSDRDGNAEIYVMNADGSSPVRFTNDPGADLDPVWSPDGSKIAFWSDRDGNAEIYVMSAADGTGLARLTNYPGLDADPAWSPDGTKIAFLRDYYAIMVMNADGSDQRLLVDWDDVQGDPTWSPDGTEIAFARQIYTGEFVWAIVIVRADGTGLVELTKARASDPDWRR